VIPVQVLAKRPKVEATALLGRSSSIDLDRACRKLGLRSVQCASLEVTTHDPQIEVTTKDGQVLASASGPGSLRAKAVLTAYKGTGSSARRVRWMVDLVVRFAKP
jgi:hypothetical protein